MGKVNLGLSKFIDRVRLKPLTFQEIRLAFQVLGAPKSWSKYFLELCSDFYPPASEASREVEKNNYLDSHHLQGV